MKKTLRAGVTALLFTSVAGNALAANNCAQQKDMQALQAAAVQQQLMVAALSCNAIKLYNDFVIAYQKELQDSDKALQQFFRRLAGRSEGTAQYHAFKTKLANSSSIRSVGDMGAYCANAQAAFSTALGAAKTTLTAFVSAQPIDATEGFEACTYRMAEGYQAAAPSTVPVPMPKPAETVIPAQGVGPAIRPTTTQ